MEPNDLKGKVAIVTGSATGIGAATAELLASKGCNVVINYTRSEKEAKETEAACRRHQVDTMLCQADVSKDADCRRMADDAAKKFGRLDIVVCCAGKTKFVKSQDMEELSAQDFQDIYAVNTIGTYQSIRAALPHFRKQGGGVAAIVSALGAIDGTGSCMAYSASKGAISARELPAPRPSHAVPRASASITWFCCATNFTFWPRMNRRRSASDMRLVR